MTPGLITPGATARRYRPALLPGCRRTLPFGRHADDYLAFAAVGMAAQQVGELLPACLGSLPHRLVQQSRNRRQSPLAFAIALP